MDSYLNMKCWEIMNCNNLDCPARSEPETPCWEIAKKIEDYRNVSNTCRDCVVYLLKKNTAILSKREVENILNQRKLPGNIGTGHLVCALKSST